MTHNKDRILSNLRWAIGEGRCDAIEELQIPADVKSCLLYHTNDLCLSESQFCALQRVTEQIEQFYVVQCDSDEVIRLDGSTPYEAYAELNLYSMTYLTSDRFEWVVVIDEHLESGIGVIVSKTDLIDRYASFYPKLIADAEDLFRFLRKDLVRNPKAALKMETLSAFQHPNAE